MSRRPPRGSAQAFPIGARFGGWVAERADLDAFVRASAPSAVTEAWRADANGCEHQYRTRLPRGEIRRRLEQLASTLEVTPKVDATFDRRGRSLRVGRRRPRATFDTRPPR